MKYKIRTIWSIIYFVLGLILLVPVLIMKSPPLIEFLKGHYLLILWSAGWSAIGIAAGLWNGRKSKGGNEGSCCHFFTYFIFALFVSTAAAFSLQSLYKYPYTYSAACFIAIVIGFSSEHFEKNIPLK